MLLLLLIVVGPPLISLLLVGLAPRWLWFAIFATASVALIGAEWIWALSMPPSTGQALVGQHAILWGGFLFFGIVGKAVSLFLARSNNSALASYGPVAAGFLLPVALIFLLQIETLFW